MKLRILYFARLRELMGRSEDQLELPAQVATVAQLQQWLVAQGEPWAQAFTAVRGIRAAINQVMATADTSLAGAIEVAFFPPVTGG